MLRTAAALLLAGLSGAPEASLPAGRAPHPMSVSHLQVEVGERQIGFELTLQTLTLVETVSLGLDRDGDQELSEGEIAAGWDALTGYLELGLQLQLDGEPAPLAFSDWRFGGGGSELVGESSDSFQWMTLSGRLERPAPPGQVSVSSELFFDDGNPDHRMFVAVRGLAGAELYGLVSARSGPAISPRRRSPAIWASASSTSSRGSITWPSCWRCCSASAASPACWRR